ncbi:hypothetical protein [Pseudomonas akapageensis]|uniref:hypothetical protein n=1 Tax=Pseudomonas akapageensis TaxID=2609961 RepID=UPI00140947B9|nr:hypothetical protein [Pseudomonas akapageensis]
MDSQARNDSLKTLLVFLPLLMLSLTPGLSGAHGCQFLLPWAAIIWYAARLEHSPLRWAIMSSLVLLAVSLRYHEDSSLIMSAIAVLYVFIWL